VTEHSGCEPTLPWLSSLFSIGDVQANVMALGKTFFLLEQTDDESWVVEETMECDEHPFVENYDDADVADAFASATIVNHTGGFIRTGDVTTLMATVSPQGLRDELMHLQFQDEASGGS
jgi:hypothetical protein